MKIFISIVAAAAMLLFLIDTLSPLGYDRKEFDYATGKIRILHRTCGFVYSTTYDDHWLEAYSKPAQTSDWHFLRYANNFAPRINTNAGKLQSRIRSIGQSLQMTNANEPTRQLVADFIFEQLRLNESAGDDSVDALSIFMCLLDNWPTDEYFSKSIPIKIVLSIINHCTNPD